MRPGLPDAWQGIWQVFVHFEKFWQKNVAIAMLLNILIFRYLMFLQFIFFPHFSIFNVWQSNWSPTVKHRTSNYASRKLRMIRMITHNDYCWAVFSLCSLGTHLINNPKMDYFVNTDNWYFKKWQNYGIKIYCQKNVANFLESNDFWQYLPNLAPTGNSGD